jgi:hypothetical protein
LAITLIAAVLKIVQYASAVQQEGIAFARDLKLFGA